MDPTLRFTDRTRRMALPRRSFFLASTALATLLATRAAGAQQLEAPTPETSHRGGVYLHSSVGAGYAHYWQIGAADREASGFGLDTQFAVGYALNDRFAAGFAMIYQMYFGMQVNNLISGNQYNVPLSPFGGGGLSLAFAPGGRDGRLALDLFLGCGGGGGSARWGGFGALVGIEPTVRLLNTGRNHVGIAARLLYGQLFWSDNSAVRPFVEVSVGLDWALF